MPNAKRLVWVVAMLAWPAWAVGQPSTAVGEDGSNALLPAGIALSDVHIDGQLAYLSTDAEGVRVIHMVGDFALTAGDRRVSAAQGIVWMTPRRHGNRDYYFLEVFLYRDVRVEEPAGTVTEGPLLFVTLSAAGNMIVSADRRAFASSAGTTIFRDAAAVRERVRFGRPADADPAISAPVTVTPEGFTEPPIKPELIVNAGRTRMGKTEAGDTVITYTEGVDLFRGAAGATNALEIQADAAVVFVGGGRGDTEGSIPTVSVDGELGNGANFEAVYLEGDIRMTLGDRNVRASRLYYDLVYDRALILDAVAHAIVTERDLPIYFRAARIRQLSDRRYVAKDAVLTTSEFHTPHYHIGTSRLELNDRTRRTYFDQRGGLARANYKMGPATFNLYNVPVLFWPGASGKVTLADSAIRRISAGYDGDFGYRIETKWDVFSLLSLEAPTGYTADLSLDLFTDRGPAVGLDVDYERDDYFGTFLGYGIDDRSDDHLGRSRDNERGGGSRGRATWRHRHYLPEDWQLTIEASYISDRGFLEEFFESEFDEGKQQESLLYVKKQRDHWAFTGLALWRLNDFFTQTERLPDFSFRFIGHSLGDVASWYSENRAGYVRYRAAEKELFLLLREGPDGPSSSATARVESRQELTFPFGLGPVNIVPFVSLRGSAWGESRDRSFLSPRGGYDGDGGGIGRLFATYGVRASTYFARVFPGVRNELMDLNGLRHVIKPEVVAWASHSNRDPADLFPFDEGVERIDDFDGVLVGVHQRLQTKRGASDKRRVVDWITLDVDLGLFNNGAGDYVTNGFVSFSRPEDSIPRNFINTALNWRINDSTLILGEMNYDLNDGEVDRLDLALQVDRTPRFSYGLDYRFIEETDSNLLGFELNYRADEKHAFAVRELFDLERGRTHDFSVTYIRKYPRWYVALVFELDEAEDNAGVSLSIWPEGLPRAAVGGRRFTGLATSTALNPDE